MVLRFRTPIRISKAWLLLLSAAVFVTAVFDLMNIRRVQTALQEQADLLAIIALNVARVGNEETDIKHATLDVFRRLKGSEISPDEVEVDVDVSNLNVPGATTAKVMMTSPVAVVLYRLLNGGEFRIGATAHSSIERREGCATDCCRFSC